MAIQSGDLITKQDIIDRFTERVRNQVTAYTDKQYNSDALPGAANPSGNRPDPNDPRRTVYTFTSGHAETSNPTGNLKDSGGPSVAHLDNLAGTKINQNESIVGLLSDWARIYSRHHRVYFNNTGNLGGSHSTVIRFKAGYDKISATDIQNLANQHGLYDGNQRYITATGMYNFIEAIRSLWFSRCRNSGNHRTYSYRFCHANHSSHGSHGNRGRR